MSDDPYRRLEVLVVEDHPAVRRGLELLLREAGMWIAGVATSVPEARDLLVRRRFDVGLVDLGLPGGSGVDVVRAALEHDPDAAIVLYTGETDAERLHAASASGARGFVLKGSPAASLFDALRRVAAGGTYIDPGLTAALAVDSSAGRLATLTRRERQILELLAEGLTGEQVADQLVLSAETVRTHIRNATNKLGAKTRVQAVALLIQAEGGRLPGSARRGA